MIDEAKGETRIIRKVLGIVAVSLEDATKPTILRVGCETATGPLVVRLSQIAGVELAAILNSHPLTRGSA
jgi:hypothetical protein